MATPAKPTLNWYINPDGVDTFIKWAEQCSTDDYTIEIQMLPTSATDQRVQLARRLAAEDSTTDLMNLDPVFVAEFANAGWLAEVEGGIADEVQKSVDGDGDYLKGAADTVTWEDGVFAFPLWANTQVLWFRKSLAEAAGLDMTQPVTWDQVIQAAADNEGTVGVQANRYEAYVVWINALVQGAGGAIVSDTEAGNEAQVDIDSDAGRAAAEVIKQLADSPAAQPDFSVSNEGTSLGQMFPADGAGEFMTNWTFVYKNYEGLVGKAGGPADEEQFKDLGWARYPRDRRGRNLQATDRRHRHRGRRIQPASRVRHGGGGVRHLPGDPGRPRLDGRADAVHELRLRGGHQGRLLPRGSGEAVAHQRR